MALMAPNSRAPIWAFWNLGTATVMMIRIIEITISSSIREKPRRRLIWGSIRSLLFYDAEQSHSVEARSSGRSRARASEQTLATPRRGFASSGALPTWGEDGYAGQAR